MNSKVAGLDLHKNRSYITIMDGSGQIVNEESLASKAGAILNYLRQFEEPEAVFESTRNWY